MLIPRLFYYTIGAWKSQDEKIPGWLDRVFVVINRKGKYKQFVLLRLGL